jgi:hypothetical protein
MSDTDARTAHLLLTHEIADFLYREAELLDERRYDEWLALLADDLRYWMPMRRNVKYGEEGHPRRAGYRLVRRGQGHAGAPGQNRSNRHSLGRGAGVANLAPSDKCALVRRRPRCGSAG